VSVEPLSPDPECLLCPRLTAFRSENKARFPDWHNAPVPSFGDLNAAVLIVGLAPGLRGANRTGRPFTGDYAGDLLYQTLLKFGLAEGAYRADPADDLVLRDCRITNAVRCVPPGNRPTTAETKECSTFLSREMRAMPRLRAIVALGTVAHKATLSAFKLSPSRFAFAHGACHGLPGDLLLVDSFHCSRLNTNTGRLTTEMFENVFARVRELKSD